MTKGLLHIFNSVQINLPWKDFHLTMLIFYYSFSEFFNHWFLLIAFISSTTLFFFILWKSVFLPYLTVEAILSTNGTPISKPVAFSLLPFFLTYLLQEGWSNSNPWNSSLSLYYLILFLVLFPLLYLFYLPNPFTSQPHPLYQTKEEPMLQKQERIWYLFLSSHNICLLTLTSFKLP